jgi:hypothetical protein
VTADAPANAPADVDPGIRPAVTPEAGSGPEVPTGLPPVTEIATVTLALIVVGGIYMSAYLPRHSPLGVPFGLLGAAAVLIVTNLVLLVRLRVFAWGLFFRVWRWALLAYCVVAGMLEYVFVYDGTRGKMLLVLSLMLAVFALTVPTIIAFTVARFQAVDPEATRAESR